LPSVKPMPFTFLLWHCLRPGQTSVGAGKVRAFFERENDECVLVFDLDNDHFRKEFEVDEDEKRVCDHLFFHKKAEGPPTLVFVELKGSDVKHGITQLRSTIEMMRRRLPKYAGRDLVAVVVTSGGAPRNLDDLCEDFWKALTVRLHVKRGKVDLRSLLPRTPSAAE